MGRGYSRLVSVKAGSPRLDSLTERDMRDLLNKKKERKDEWSESGMQRQASWVAGGGYSRYDDQLAGSSKLDLARDELIKKKEREDECSENGMQRQASLDMAEGYPRYGDLQLGGAELYLVFEMEKLDVLNKKKESEDEWSENGMQGQESWDMAEGYPRYSDLQLGSAELHLVIEMEKRDVPIKKKEREDEWSENGMQAAEAEMYKDYDLYLAAKNGQLDHFKRILDRVSKAESGDILSRLSHTGNTFLHVAAKHGNQDIVAFIARKNSSLLLAKDFNGETALHLVAKDGDESMVKALVQIHRDLHSLSQDENNLLMAKNAKGNTALHEALLFSGEKSESKSKSIAKYLIQQDPLLSYHQNQKNQSALYLAAKNGFVGCVSLILQQCTDEESLNEIFKKKSPIKAAIKRKHRDVLESMFEENPRLIQMRDDEGRNPLHFAASLGHLEEARYLLQKYPLNATQIDKHGALPIHLAALEDHVDIINLFLQKFPDAGELLDTSGCNILHLAAKSGRYNVFTFVLKNPSFNYLINMKDKSGNTPLHWASSQFHPKMVYTLTWDKRADIKAVNNYGMTALDAAEDNMPHKYNPQFRERLTWAALKAASVPSHHSNRKASDRNKRFNMNYYKERVNTLLLMATLVATVTFAAGFTMPGGYNSSDSDSDLGMAKMLREKGFHVFVFCDTIAMYTSIFVATALIWAQLGDLTLAIKALTLAVPLLGIALGMMSMAFAAGIIVVVTKLKWLSSIILAMGISFAMTPFLLLLPLCFSYTSRSPILRYLSYYPFLLLILVTGNH